MTKDQIEALRQDNRKLRHGLRRCADLAQQSTLLHIRFLRSYMEKIYEAAETALTKEDK